MCFLFFIEFTFNYFEFEIPLVKVLFSFEFDHWSSSKHNKVLNNLYMQKSSNTPQKTDPDWKSPMEFLMMFEMMFEMMFQDHFALNVL